MRGERRMRTRDCHLFFFLPQPVHLVAFVPAHSPTTPALSHAVESLALSLSCFSSFRVVRLLDRFEGKTDRLRARGCSVASILAFTSVRLVDKTHRACSFIIPRTARAATYASIFSGGERSDVLSVSASNLFRAS